MMNSLVPLGGVDTDLTARLPGILALYDASPHFCAGGCGSKMLRAGVTCSDCDAKVAAAARVRGLASATLFTVQARYRWAHFDAPELAGRVRDAAATARARAFVDGTADRLVLVGPAGTGKTVLGVCALRAWSSKLGVVGHFVPAITLGLARMQADLGEEAKPVRDALQADICLIDDVGQERVSPQSAVCDVIHARHADMRPTIITTGFEAPAISAKYGDGVARRVFEGATVIRLTPGSAAVREAA